MADNQWDNSPDFDPVDVSKPVAPRREKDIIAEQKAAYRREWLHAHLTHIFIVIGVVAVGLVFLFISLYNQSSNPISRLMSSSSKDLSVPFDFSVTVNKDGSPVMSYSGSADINSRKHSVKVVYDADYNDYTYKGVVFADDTRSAKGYYYKDKWTVSDCSEQIGNFYDFDTDYRAGKFDAGAFLRFTGLTSRYSAAEFEKFAEVMKERLSSDSALANVTKTDTDGGASYRYDFDLDAVFKMITDDGASIFYSADDYNAFKELYELNAADIRNADLVMDFTVNSGGYMSAFELSLTTPEHSYSINCKMSGFNTAVTKIPVEFLDTATVSATED